MAPNNGSKNDTRNQVIGWLQLIAIVLGLGAVLVRIGIRDERDRMQSEQIKGLFEINKELTNGQVKTTGDIHRLELRLQRLETIGGMKP